MFPDQALGEGAVLQPGVGSEAAQSSSQGKWHVVLLPLVFYLLALTVTARH